MSVPGSSVLSRGAIRGRRSSTGRLGGRSGALAALALVVALLALPVAAGAEVCPNASLRNGPSVHLSDCRAYEMVTPPFKDTGSLGSPISTAAMGVNPISPEGTAVGISSIAAFAGQAADPGLATTYTVRRTGSGWVTTGDNPPASEYLPFLLDGFYDSVGSGEDAETTLWLERRIFQPDNQINLYKREADGSIVEVGPALPPSAPTGHSIDELGSAAQVDSPGTSADMSHVFVTLTGDYWPFDHTSVTAGAGYVSVYEYQGTGNTTPRLVGVNDAGEQITLCGTVLGGGEAKTQTGDGTNAGHNAISADGDTVFFTAFGECGSAGPPVNELFARVDNGQPGARTVAISEPTVEDCSACDTRSGVLADAGFIGASEDGSKVFFQTTQPLLGSDASNNIYEYDFDAPAGERVVRVSGGDATVSESTAGVVGYPQVSEDGSHVYFIARGVLTRNVNHYGQSAQPGANNFYLFERDAQYPAGRTVFVADLSLDGAETIWGHVADFQHDDAGADLTPDGRFLLFTSHTDLTPGDTSTAQQVFEYDAETGVLTRVSVGQGGFNDDGNTAVANAEIVSPEFRSADGSSYWSHLSVSADGAYVFFQSPDGLTPEALNNQVIGYTESGCPGCKAEPVYAYNVYEYHEGVVSLISDGQDITGLISSSGESNVALVGTDPSGRDVFFLTADSLVAQDTDGNVDLYDARVDGGFPPPSPAPACSEEACQGPLSGSPALLSPGSEFQAGANLVPAPEAKPAQAKKSAKKSHKKKKKKKKRRSARKAAGKSDARRGGR
jgi:hypothetical protein